jgi:thiopurine S-methyltransferase
MLVPRQKEDPVVMAEEQDPAGWRQRWVEGRTGFHQDEVNGHLVDHWPTQVESSTARVLVPLCGKSSDMLWLRQRGHDVVGVELSELACRAFFADNELEFDVADQGSHLLFSALGEGPKLQLICGDFFTLDVRSIGLFEAWYDRAALVALPPVQWPEYAAALGRFLSPGAPALMVTFEYPQSEREGPPYSVSFEDVQRELRGQFSLSLLDRVSRTEDNRWELSEVYEPVIFLVRS